LKTGVGNIAFALLLAGACRSYGGNVATGRIDRISIETDRVHPAVLRRELTFREGDLLTNEALEESRLNLYRLNLLKSLTIETAPDGPAERDGIHVLVKAQDGWFAMPWPMFGSRGGTRYAMLTLMQFNFFREAESLVLTGILQDDEWSGLCAFSTPRYAMMAGRFESERTEYVYADGAFSAMDFEASLSRNDAEDFGETTEAYRKRSARSQIVASFPLYGDWNLALGGKAERAHYAAVAEGSALDAEDHLSLSVALGWGDEPTPYSGFIGMFGRLFGLGMAGVQDASQPLLRARTTRSARLEMEGAHSLWGSNESFVKAEIRVRQQTLFRNRNRLSLSLGAAAGGSLPPGQMLTTSRAPGLQGVYAREYRGDRLASGSAAWTRGLLRSRLGGATAHVFGEYAVAWEHGRPRSKQGLGGRLIYQFWRFPFPLGAGYTYSLDDRNGQVSLALGGMF
jgi:hypothetical protein